MHNHYSLYLFLLLAVPLACHAQGVDDGERDQKLISTFQIVRFPNDACTGSNSKNGTCYTSAECSDKDGTSSGSCADGFGVCCTFIITTCDQTTGENITYWTQPSTTPYGTCGLTVCPVSDDICQLRLDFTTFIITGPSTLTTSQARRRFGQPVGNLEDAGGVFTGGVNMATNCLLDMFTVQGASPSSNPPLVCGILTGTHMYVESDQDRCNKLNFNFADVAHSTITDGGTRGLAALVSSRTWDITVQQFECTHPNLPPVGCTQYFYGSQTINGIASYNYQTLGSSVHLANQHQRICIRRERGMCIGCFYGADADFMVSGNPGTSVNYSVASGCCGYASVEGDNMSTVAFANVQGTSMNDSTQYGWDCVIIPGAFGPMNSAIAGQVEVTQTTADIQQKTLSTNLMPLPWPPQICGNNKGLGIGSDMDNSLVNTANWADEAGSATNLTVCTRHTPFTIEFMSDDLEGMGATAGMTEYSNITQGINNGFSLHHTQIACTSSTG